MFDISFMEILVISIVALIVIGPERLPGVARTVGHLYARLRGFVYNVRTDIHNEMRMEELKKMQSSVHDTVQSIEESVQHEVNQLKNTVTPSSTDESTPNHSPAPQAPLQSHAPNGESLDSERGKEKN
ncbi:MAG TPA: Sec-independent protein translocase protein TatB [Nitrosomonas sp.]|nr:Sec-independent protein translocase protein TatB [Nitrosomonas sp.]